MNNPRMRRLAITVLVSFLLSFFPPSSVHADTISGEATWSADQPLTEDLLIESGGHLTIEAGVVVTAACEDANDQAYNPDRIEIVVQPGGQLTADNVTFQGDGSAGCWGGIVINSEDGLTSIENSTIRDTDQGIYIIDSSPTLRGNEITNVKGADGTSTELDGAHVYGILIGQSELPAAPLIENNHIHHLTAGEGDNGTDGANASVPGAVGGNGATGGYGGDAYGIRSESGANPVILDNQIDHIYSGTCGDGGTGGTGAAGANGVANGEAGGQGGDGGAGGQTYYPGAVFGIYAYDNLDTNITGNEIAYLYQADGCSGGAGGNGGAGGQGADGGGEAPTGGQGGQGGNGGVGGYAGYNSDGVTGIYVDFPFGSQGNHTTIDHNILHDFFAGDGNQGGVGGSGGNGANGGAGDPVSTTGVGDGGVGGGGGGGAYGSAGGIASDVFGISLERVSLDIEANKIYNLNAGNGSVGGTGGDGGNSGHGGLGGYYVAGDTYGNGGDGWAGGPGGLSVPGGSGGFATAIKVYGASDLVVGLINNDIWAIRAGLGGDGGLPGNGGDGGNGGDTYNTNFGTGGDGGPGAPGGPGGAGGNSMVSTLVYLDSVIGEVYNNTMVSPSAYTSGGTRSLGGLGGSGGLGGNGLSDGSDGVDGMNGPSGGSSYGGYAYGLYQSMGSGQTRVVNNIIYQGNFAINAVGLVDSGAVFQEVDYNNINNWYPNYDNTNGAGDHAIEGNPVFMSSVDHRLQGGSPCIDTGNNTGAPSDDINGDPRPVDGDGDSITTVDMGAYELQNILYPCYLPLMLR